MVLKIYVVVKYIFFFCRFVVISLVDEGFILVVLVFKICVVEEYVFFFLFFWFMEVDFFDDDFKLILLVFLWYFGVEYVFCFLFIVIVILFNEVVEDICMNWEIDEWIVLDLIVEFSWGCVLYLIFNFFLFLFIKII